MKNHNTSTNRIEVKESKSEMLKLCRYGYGNFKKQTTIIPSNNMILNTTIQIFWLLLTRKYVCRLVPINWQLSRQRVYALVDMRVQRLATELTMGPDVRDQPIGTNCHGWTPRKRQTRGMDENAKSFKVSKLWKSMNFLACQMGIA